MHPRRNLSFSAENNQSTSDGNWQRGATYLHGKNAGRGVGHRGEALDAGEGRGGNSEHGELHGYRLVGLYDKRWSPGS
jgi:hypothetical protein